MAAAFTKRAILITGATGKQGGATINALLNAGALSSYHILALTRNQSSPSAKNLASRGVKLVSGDLGNVPDVFRKAKRVAGGPIWGVFSVQTPMGKGASVETEETQGKALVDEALANDVKHFVYSSVDRGGDTVSFKNPTDIPHFKSKHLIEHHLVNRAGSKMSWTILRPVFFMDNISPDDFVAKVTASGWRITLGNDKTLQVIAARDIGWFAAQAFLRSAEFSGRAISLAGDELTYGEANRIFEHKIGHPFPEAPSLVVRFLLASVRELKTMFRFFKTQGYGANIQALKEEHHGLLSWSEWLDADGKRLWKK